MFKHLFFSAKSLEKTSRGLVCLKLLCGTRISAATQKTQKLDALSLWNFVTPLWNFVVQLHSLWHKRHEEGTKETKELSPLNLCQTSSIRYEKKSNRMLDKFIISFDFNENILIRIQAILNHFIKNYSLPLIAYCLSSKLII